LERVRIIDLLRLYRVKDWVHFLPLPLVGWAAAPAPRSPSVLAGAVFGWALALAYASALNQAFDGRVDRLQRGKNPVGSRLATPDALRLAALPLVAAPVVLGLLAPAGLAALAVFVAAATLYSAPPRLKRVPILGTLWNLPVGVPGMFFAARPAALAPPSLLLVVLFCLLLLASQLLHEAQDRDDDAQGGVRTVATLGGRRLALHAAAAVLLATPPVGFCLAGFAAHRPTLTVVLALFSGAWAALIAAHLAAGTAALRRLRLAFRYATLTLGAVVLALVTT
jgi:4-hydroxybenzoate polyprenyltransferase